MPEQPSFEQLIRMQVVHQVPGMQDVTVRRNLTYAEGDPGLLMDVYRPPGAGPAASW